MTVTVDKITHHTRPNAIEVYSVAARKQVQRTIAALAHHEQDNDVVSQARVAEALSAMARVAELDQALRDFDKELDKTVRTVQNDVYGVQDRLRKLKPSTYARQSAYVAPKGSTHVRSTGQAKPQGSSTPSSV